MKAVAVACSLGLMALASVASPARAQEVTVEADIGDAPVNEEVSVDSFNPVLSPYGEWVEVGGMGRVWRPYSSVVGADFRPYYSGGHWVYTAAGWTYVSDYAWGWAPFHYGRWWLDPVYGWVWLPGRRWAPAWVEWRHGGEYVGWAPLAPVGYHFGVALYGRSWCFLETRYLVEPRFHHYIVPVERVRTVYTTTSPIPVSSHSRSWNPGPAPTVVSTASGRTITPVSVPPSARPTPTAVAPSGRNAGPSVAPSVGQGTRVGQPANPIGAGAHGNNVPAAPSGTAPSGAGPSVREGQPTNPIGVGVHNTGVPGGGAPSVAPSVGHTGPSGLGIATVAPSHPVPGAESRPSIQPVDVGHTAPPPHSPSADGAPSTPTPPSAGRPFAAPPPTPHAVKPDEIRSAPIAPRAAPAYQAAPSRPATQMAPAAQHYSPPAQHAAPQAQHYSPPAQHAAPQAQHYSPPAARYSPPAAHVAPAMHPSGGARKKK